MFVLWIHTNSSRCYPTQVIPFGNLTGQSVFAALRSLSQLTTSFIAYWHQGIHDALFVA